MSIEAQYALKLDDAGIVTGIGLIADIPEPDIGSMIREGKSEAEITKALYASRPSYGPGNGLDGRDNILYLLMLDGVEINRVLAHAYEHNFYFDVELLSLITRHKRYRMAVTEARLMLGSVSYGAPR